VGLIVILIGLIVAIFVNAFWGLVIIVVGIVLLFVPRVPYGYSSWRGRRGPPP
jgi:hypothetical protein